MTTEATPTPSIGLAAAPAQREPNLALMCRDLRRALSEKAVELKPGETTRPARWCQDVSSVHYTATNVLRFRAVFDGGVAIVATRNYETFIADPQSVHALLEELKPEWLRNQQS